jgi:hypothetical protein
VAATYLHMSPAGGLGTIATMVMIRPEEGKRLEGEVRIARRGGHPLGGCFRPPSTLLHSQPWTH